MFTVIFLRNFKSCKFSSKVKFQNSASFSIVFKLHTRNIVDMMKSRFPILYQMSSKSITIEQEIHGNYFTKKPRFAHGSLRMFSLASD